MIIEVMVFPQSESCKILVNFESLEMIYLVKIEDFHWSFTDSKHVFHWKSMQL
jgi:hypothetical protein